MEPWFRHHRYFGYWPINRKGWALKAALGVACPAFFLIGIYLTNLENWLAIILIPMFVVAVFQLNAIIANRTRKD
ncbi:hypothetical protein D3C72_2160050 [compost metagenome]